MGTFGTGPFDSDDALDFLDTLGTSPSRGVAQSLRDISKLPSGEYIEVDVGSAAWAAAELVALAFGRGPSTDLNDGVLDLVGRLRTQEKLRLLALAAVERIADRDASELAGLWHEGAEGLAFDARLDDLKSRLTAASAGPLTLPRPKPGDVLAFPSEAHREFFVVQVLASNEIAVFQGVWVDDADVSQGLKDRPARRAIASAAKLFNTGRLIGNAPVRKDLKGKKLYAMESGGVDQYCLMTAAGGGYRSASFDEASAHDRHVFHDLDSLSALAQGKPAQPRVRPPDEREAELRELHRAEWNARRATTSPGPFGDTLALKRLIEWIELTDIENVVLQMRRLAAGESQYGRPNEESERGTYAFAGLVALWLGRWPPEDWPDSLASHLPPPPNPELLALAVASARVLAGQVLTRDAELRLIWDDAPDGGAGLREIVTSLNAALGQLT